MDITSPPNTLRPVAATIDIPDPAPWTVLEGDANTENYGWRQPRHNAYTSRRGFDDDFARVLSNASGLQFALHFAAAVRAVTELERLADSRQTKFERKPMKDGSNLFGFTPNPLTGEVELNGGEGLRSMYQYMKEVLQMLYRNNLLHISALGQYEPLQQSMLQLQGKSRMAKGRHGFRDPERGQVLCCNNGAMATEDSNLDYRTRLCIDQNWPGGIQGALDHNHHERWFRGHVAPNAHNGT